jgi:hypothetical protein
MLTLQIGVVPMSLPLTHSMVVILAMLFVADSHLIIIVLKIPDPNWSQVEPL